MSARFERPAAADLHRRAELDQAAIERSMTEVLLRDGRRTDVLDVGEGEPLIFLPMISEMNFVYTPQVVRFQEVYDTLGFALGVVRDA